MRVVFATVALGIVNFFPLFMMVLQVPSRELVGAGGQEHLPSLLFFGGLSKMIYLIPGMLS